MNPRANITHSIRPNTCIVNAPTRSVHRFTRVPTTPGRITGLGHRIGRLATGLTRLRGRLNRVGKGWTVGMIIANKDNCVNDIAVHELVTTNRRVTIFSGLRHNRGRAVPRNIHLCINSLHSVTTVSTYLGTRHPSTIVRFTTCTLINRSVHRPRLCFSGGILNNVGLLRTVHGCSVHRVIFSSDYTACNRPNASFVSRAAVRGPAGPCNRSGLVFRGVLH